MTLHEVTEHLSWVLEPVKCREMTSACYSIGFLSLDQIMSMKEEVSHDTDTSGLSEEREGRGPVNWCGLRLPLCMVDIMHSCVLAQAGPSATELTF